MMAVKVKFKVQVKFKVKFKVQLGVRARVEVRVRVCRISFIVFYWAMSWVWVEVRFRTYMLEEYGLVFQYQD